MFSISSDQSKFPIIEDKYFFIFYSLVDFEHGFPFIREAILRNFSVSVLILYNRKVSVEQLLIHYGLDSQRTIVDVKEGLDFFATINVLNNHRTKPLFKVLRKIIALYTIVSTYHVKTFFISETAVNQIGTLALWRVIKKKQLIVFHETFRVFARQKLLHYPFPKETSVVYLINESIVGVGHYLNVGIPRYTKFFSRYLANCREGKKFDIIYLGAKYSAVDEAWNAEISRVDDIFFEVVDRLLPRRKKILVKCHPSGGEQTYRDKFETVPAVEFSSDVGLGQFCSSRTIVISSVGSTAVLDALALGVSVLQSKSVQRLNAELDGDPNYLQFTHLFDSTTEVVDYLCRHEQADLGIPNAQKFDHFISGGDARNFDNAMDEVFGR